MRINPNSKVPDPLNVPSAKPKTPAEAGQNAGDFTASTQMTKSLEKLPLVRADKVAKAKELIQDPAYPNDVTLRKVANVLTDHIKPEGPEGSPK
jgi:hypothetical protein